MTSLPPPELARSSADWKWAWVGLALFNALLAIANVLSGHWDVVLRTTSFAVVDLYVVMLLTDRERLRTQIRALR